MVVTLDEAEDLIPILQNVKDPVTHQATYAAPFTRRMLQFNSLDFYAIPNLQPTWKAPAWLKNELGLLAGRLYFEFHEIDSIKIFLRLKGSDHFATEDRRGGTTGGCASQQDPVQLPVRSAKQSAKSVAFLQDWLAVKRKGQEFAHTPMGFMCENKALVAQHPFFARIPTESSPKGSTDDPEANLIAPTSNLGFQECSSADDSETSSIDEGDEND